MKKLFIILSIGLCSCSEIFPSNGKFIVVSVRSNEEGMATYSISSIKGVPKFCIKDSANKYKVGDTIILIKQPQPHATQNT